MVVLKFSFFSIVTRRQATQQSNENDPREIALAHFTDYCSQFSESFLGITEGVLLAEEAHSRGYETESWVLDAGEAPHERDWLAQEKNLQIEAFFTTREAATQAEVWLNKEYVLENASAIEDQPEQDWNATWKAAFTGIDVDETLRVLPPWHEEWLKRDAVSDQAKPLAKQKIIAINPGAGFGTGTHETTQLCLKILRSLGDLSGKTVLDFGSGSGILGITAATQGARVYCIEIDELANDNARENAQLNGVEKNIIFSKTIPAEIKNAKVDILIANILRPILIQFAPELKAALKPNAHLVLSGLIESDLPEVIRVYQSRTDQPTQMEQIKPTVKATEATGNEKFSNQQFEINPFKINQFEKNEWRALWLRL